MRTKFFYFISALSLVLSASLLTAQPISEPTYEMKLEFAHELFAERDYFNALDMFQECYRESRDRELLPYLARLNFILRDYERARRWFERYLPRDEHFFYIEDRFIYARTLRILGEEEKALESFLEFLELTDNDSLKNRVEIELVGMELAKGQSQPDDLFITALGETVNSGLTDLSPAVGPDGRLYYATFNRRSRITYSEDEQPHFLRIYSAPPDDDSWGQGERMRHRINREHYHTGNVAFSRDKNTMFFTRSKIKGEILKESEIFMSTWDGSDWGAPQKLEGVNGDWIATHPAPGELFGNPVLFFTGNLDGGRGGYDIYYATHQGGNRYGTPVNLGGVINTSGNEKTPFYVNGTLYFSSDGHPGMGGYDIFKSTWDGTRWSDPQNMGPGFNSPFDDLYPRLDEDARDGFIVSNRPYERKRTSRSPSCCDDIFEVSVADVTINYIATALDENNEPLIGSTVRVQEFRRGEIYNEVSATSEQGNSFNIPLQADRSYVIILERDNYLSDSVEVNTVGITENTTIERDFFLFEREPDFKIVSINEAIRLSNIYYDFDDDAILPEAEQDLDYLYDLMIEYDDMVIELASHTDARGRPSYNMDLSQRRANSAKEYLVNRGIDPERIRPVGYGETRIINHCHPGVECTEEEHRENRRTEFTIVEGPMEIEIQKQRIELRGDEPQGFQAPQLKKEFPTGLSVRELAYVFGYLNDNERSSGVASFYGSVSAITRLDSLAKGDRDDLAQVDPGEDEKFADIHFEKQFHDFGVITKSDRPEYTFEFTNTGEVDLIIDFVTACECTELEWTTSPIPPGQRGQIRAVYDPTERDGEQEVTIDIIANTDPIVKSARFRVFISDEE